MKLGRLPARIPSHAGTMNRSTVQAPPEDVNRAQADAFPGSRDSSSDHHSLASIRLAAMVSLAGPSLAFPVRGLDFLVGYRNSTALQLPADRVADELAAGKLASRVVDLRRQAQRDPHDDKIIGLWLVAHAVSLA